MWMVECKEGPQQGLRKLDSPSGISGTSLAKYEPVVTTEPALHTTPFSAPSAVKQHCITVMEVYKNKSLEELRLEDYNMRRLTTLKFGDKIVWAGAGRTGLDTVDDRLKRVEHKLALLPTRVEFSAVQRNVLEAKARCIARQVAGAAPMQPPPQRDEDTLRRLELLLNTATQETTRAVAQLLETTASDAMKVRLDELERRIETAAIERKALARTTEELQRQSDVREQEAAMIDEDVVTRLGCVDKRLDALEAAHRGGWGVPQVALLVSAGCNVLLLGALLYRSCRK